jgi:hypothetical protein
MIAVQIPKGYAKGKDIITVFMLLGYKWARNGLLSEFKNAETLAERYDKWELCGLIIIPDKKEVWFNGSIYGEMPTIRYKGSIT